jgi:hypothetical protein
MRRFILSIFVAGAALAVAPAAAEQKSPASANAHHSVTLASMIGLRLRSIELQIDILRDRDRIGREEARDLRALAQRLEQRLARSSDREARDVEAAVDRLQEQLRSASDDMRLDSYAARRDLGRFDDGQRYPRDDDSYSSRDDDQPADPRGDPFAIWKERDERGPH